MRYLTLDQANVSVLKVKLFFKISALSVWKIKCLIKKQGIAIAEKISIKHPLALA